MSETKYISEIISEKEIVTWENQNILITAPTGAGKSYFIKNKLYDYAVANNKKILYLLPRLDTVLQFRDEIQRGKKTDVITIKSYQEIEKRELKKVETDLSNYDYIVVDECHYFLSDSKFNFCTDISFNAILQIQNITRVFITATSDKIRRYLTEEQKIELKEYKVEGENHISTLYFYKDDSAVNELMQYAVHSRNKAIFFINDVRKAYRLYKKYKDYAIFNCSRYNNQYRKHRCDSEMSDLIKNERFEKLILITTSALEVGFNILDTDIHNIVIDGIDDIDSIIQCIGRKRAKNTNDTVAVYIKEFSTHSLTARVNNMNRNIRMAKYFTNHTYAEVLEAFPRKVDKSNIIYDYIDSDGSIQKAINQLMLFETKSRIEEFTTIKAIKPHGFAEYVTAKLGLTGYELYDSGEKNNDLRMYLDAMVGVVMLEHSDRMQFVNNLKIKRKSKPVKSAKALNALFESEYNLEYRIRVFETTRRFKNADGIQVKKKYKNAWKVERV